MRIIFGILPLSFFLTLACGSKEEQTRNLTRSEFSPPSQLQTITMDQKIVLTWVSANASDAFHGYQVFGRQGNLHALAGTYHVPSKEVRFNAGESIPRCQENSAFFELFGFPPTSTSCTLNEPSTIPEQNSGGNEQIAGSGARAKTYTLNNPEAPEGMVDFQLQCTGTNQNSQDRGLSLASTSSGTQGRVFCDIERVYDPESGEYVELNNGSAYTFFVASINANKNHEINWISNAVDDTPSKLFYSGSITLGTNYPDERSAEFRNFQFNLDEGEATSSAASPCDATSGVCNSKLTNNDPLGGIYFSRDTSKEDSSHAHKISISTSTEGKMQIRPRGSNTMLDYANTDSRTPTVIPYKPGDQAIKADQKYPAKGEKFSIYGNQVFDVIYALDADHIYYGKIVITQLEFKGKGKFAPAKVAITIIMQPTAGNTQY